MPEPLVQSVTLPVAGCELPSLTGPSARLPGVAQLNVGAAGVGAVVGVGVGVSVAVSAGVGVSVGVGVVVEPGCVIVNTREALRWLNVSVAWMVCDPSDQDGLT